MAEKTTEQEPSIEEILASIRQIISDDEDKGESVESPAVEEDFAPAAPVAAPAAPEMSVDDIMAMDAPVAVEPEPVPQDDLTEEELGDVLELTEAMAAPMEDEIASAPSFAIEEPQVFDAVEEEPEPMPAPVSAMNVIEDSVLTDSARSAAIASMAKLAGNMPIARASVGHSAITLEDLVREMLQPMLKDWMSENLPPMVERIVQKELEKLARQAMDS